MFQGLSDIEDKHGTTGTNIHKINTKKQTAKLSHVVKCTFVDV